jgi:hypothetical protein
MEHEEAPGVASLVKGQALFPACLWSAVTCHRFGTKAPRHRRRLIKTDLTALLLLNLDIYELESCWIWIAGVPILGWVNYGSEIAKCDLKVGVLRSQFATSKILASTSKLAIIQCMLHRHLNHSGWTLAAIDDVIARGRLDDWKQLRDAAADHTDIRERILRVAKPHLADPYAQRYHFWNLYVRKQFA